MSLRQFIESNSLTTLAAVKAKLAEQLLVDTDFWTWAGIAELVGPTNTTILSQTIRGNQLDWAADQLAGKGMQLGHPMVQAMMDQFIAAGLTFCSVIKAKPFKTRGEIAGINATDQQIEAELAAVALAASKQSIYAAGAVTYNAWVSAVDAWDGTGQPPQLGA